MKLSNAVKKATKITGQNPVIDGQFRIYNYKGYVLSFAQNGREDEATCFHTRRPDDHSDSMTDYFAGTFHDNLKQCFDFIDTCADQDAEDEAEERFFKTHPELNP